VQLTTRRIEPLTLRGPAGTLEALCMRPAAVRPGAALLCHPHPLHGGTMHTKAVYHAARALTDVGLPVLRFNFRGVGASAGEHSGGPGERDDARAALAWLATRHPGEPLLVGGFSFGAWIGCAVGQEHGGVRALVALAPPLDLYDFGFVRGDRPILCLAGDRDEFVRPERLHAWARPFGAAAHVVVLAGARHLLVTHLRAVETAVRAFAGAVLPPP
jgi:alpha/beta superfamily hydrolase